MKPLDYLTSDHPVIEMLGVSPAACDALGIGFAPRGTIIGKIGVPLRLPSGELVGYLAIATKADQSPLLLFPKNLDEMCSVNQVIEEPEPVEEGQSSPDEPRRLFRVVA